MLQEHYTKILDALTEWTVGVHHNQSKPGRKISGRPRKDNTDNEPSQPINGHPVVLSIKAVASPCDWCENTCSKEKTYSRSPGSNVWRGKCEDCGEKRNILTGQLNFTK